MRRTAYAVAGALSLALFGSVFASAAVAGPSPSGTGSRARDAIKSGSISVHRGRNGAINYLAARPGHGLAAPHGMSSRSASGAASVARTNVNDFAPIFGVTNPSADLSQVGITARSGGSIVRFQQKHNGVPVIGGQLVVSQDATGALDGINGSTGSVAGVSTTTPVSNAQAVSTAIATTAATAKVAAKSLVASAPKLSIYDPALLGAPATLGSRAVYQITVTSPTNPAVNQYVLVDAHLGAVALSFSQTETLTAPDARTSAQVTANVGKATLAPVDDPTPGTPAREVCDFGDKTYEDNNETCPGHAQPISNPAGSSIADVRDAYDLTGRVSDFYTMLGRDGIDGHGMKLISTTDFCYAADTGQTCPMDNAFWDGSQMVFGRGFAGADDVVGHELTHGVTQNTSGLLYYYQAGSINESISDVMGELFDQWNDDDSVVPGTDGANVNWLLGEDLPGGALRSMSNPAQFGQPATMTDAAWSNDPIDSGGVHTDSGVGNHAAYLMGTAIEAEAGSSQAVMIPKLAAVWLGADELLTPGATYNDLANTLNQSCQNQEAATVAGTQTTAADCAAVASAISAVKMTSTPTVGGPIAQTVSCSSSYTPVTSFSDNFNRTEGDKLGSAWAQTGSPSISYDAAPSVAAGGAMYIPDNPDTAPVTRYAYTKTPIKLSSTHANYLYFQHLDSFDWTPKSTVYGTPLEYFGGGFIDYSTNGGKSWTAAPTTATSWVNGPADAIDHTWNSAGAATSHRAGFGGDSRGWTSSRLALPSALKGKSVELRFSVTTDGFPSFSSGYGWFVDNVSVNDCVKAPLAPTNVVLNGYDKSAKMSWTASSTNSGDAIKAYAVYVEPAGGSWTRTTLAATAKSYTWTGLAKGVDYRFEIRAENVDGVYSPYAAGALAGASMQIAPPTQTITAGSQAEITGALRASDAPNNGLSSRTITLYQRQTGTTTWTKSTATAVTSSVGGYTFTVAPTTNEDYYAEYSTGSNTSMGAYTVPVSTTVS